MFKLRKCSMAKLNWENLTRKRTRNQKQDSRVPVEIRAEYHPNTRPERYLYANVLSMWVPMYSNH
jgi:hypothetical protein